MCTVRLKRILVGLLISSIVVAPGFAQTQGGQLDIEMLTQAENRAAGLRDQLVNLQMREIELQARIDELDYQMKPETIQRALAFVGSVRPMGELRSSLRLRLERKRIEQSRNSICCHSANKARSCPSRCRGDVRTTA